MNDRPSLQELIEVQSYFGLPTPALVEKDWYVVAALRAIAAVDASPFRLVFGGGTALSKAHRLVRRMSEDVDLKIVGPEDAARGAFRKLREAVTVALHGAGFEFDPDNAAQRESANGSRYTIFRLPYEPVTQGDGALRPEIQIEIASWPLRRPAVECAVSTFIAEAFKTPSELTAIPCVSVTETAAEKFVALTRRVGAEQANAGGPRDPTLVRHIYDLHMTREHYDPQEVAALARIIIAADIEAYGHQFPAYRDDPLAETRRAIAALGSDPVYAERYRRFLRDMVYGEAPVFDAACATVASLAMYLET